MLELLRQARNEDMAQERRWAKADIGRVVNRVIRYTNDDLRQFARKYGKWDELSAFVQNPDPAWATGNFDDLMKGLAVDRVWILRADASLVYQLALPNRRQLAEPSPPPGELLPLLLQKRYAYFSLRLPDGIYRVQAMPIVPLKASRTQNEPQGWLLAAKLWDAAYLRRFGKLAQSRAIIVEPGHPAGPDEEDPAGTTVGVRQPLKDSQGRVLAELLVSTAVPRLEEYQNVKLQELLLISFQGLFAFILVAVFLRYGVLIPFARISESLASRSPAPITPLLTHRSEFGHVARLVKSSFADREALQRAIDERASLERDLHDSVIQNVYAVGLNLANAQSMLPENPAEADRLINDTRAKLNGVIRDLRVYLGVIKPDWELPMPMFSKAVAAVVAQLQSQPPAQVVLGVDDHFAGEMTLDERSQLLQIVRESVSNALRHGRVSRLQISLIQEEKGALLEISDDGSGFDPAVPPRTGRGLANLAERARIIGGFLKIDSSPGHGTKIRVVLPLSEDQ
jgi:signal transduction histidine kinase